MSSKKLSPAESLQLKKKRLEDRAKSLSDGLESKFDYFQKNFALLISSSVLDSFISKMPPFARDFIHGQERENDRKVWIYSALGYIVNAAMEVAPFFLKGKKGLVISFLLKQVKKLFF